MTESIALKRVGTTLREKYTLDALIGVGGMAAVYRGAHRNGNRVAVKLLHPELSMSTDIRARFLKEGYLANAVDHPGAVRVLDDDTTEDGAVFIVMELLEGKTLGEMWERAQRHLAPKEVTEYALQLLAVLVAAHKKGIVHRDIKPENLFITREKVLKILDFGIARMRDGSSVTSATRTGRMMGTPAFMPREQAMGLTKEIDGRTDLWAVGATMFTLISGQYVHEAETPEAMMIYSATRPSRSLATVALHVPPPLAAVVDRALAFEKTDRYADAAEMLVALEAAYQSSFVDVRPEARRSSAPSMTESFAPTIAAEPALTFAPEPSLTFGPLTDSPAGVRASGAPPAPAPPIAMPQHAQVHPSAPASAMAPLSAAPHAVRPPLQPEPSTLYSPSIQLGGVSTTAGLSSERAPSGSVPGAFAQAAVGPPSSQSPAPSGSREAPPVRKGPAVLAVLAASLALVAALGVGIKVALHGGSAAREPATNGVGARPAPSSPAVAATTSDVATAAPIASATTAPVEDAGAAVAPTTTVIATALARPVAPVGPARKHDVASQPATALTTQAVTAQPTPPAPAHPAAPDCNPPVYFDPVTGKKKVKPGC